MKNRKKELLISLLAILSIFLITVGISFSFFNYARKGTEENSIKVGNVTFKYTENKDLGNGIVLTDALPIADSQGKIQTGEGKVFEFQVEANLSRSDIEYEVVVETVNDTNMPLDVIKFYLTDVTNGIEKEVETSINDDRSVKTLSEYNDTLIKNVTGKTIYKETIIKNTKGYQKRFKARMWVKEGIDWMDENYKNTQASIRINVYANSNKSIASTETTTSPDTSILRITANNKKYSFTKVNGEEYQYTLTVPNEVDTIDIDVVPNNTSATVELLEGNNNLQTGENFFKYKVMSSDQTKSSDYILRVVRQKNNVATLKKLEVAGYALQPDFDSEINEYYLTTEASSIEIIAESTSDVAIVTGTGTTNLIWGENTININVTAEDGSINTYIITITNTQPVAPVITGGSSSWSTTSKTISVKTAGTAVSGVSHYEYYKSTSSATPTDATEATGTTLGNLTISDQGTTYIWYRTVSNNNLKSSWSNSQVVNIDSEKPTTPTITGGTSSWVSTSPTIKVSTVGTATSNVKHYEYYKSTSSATPTDTTEATGTTSGNLTVSDQGTTYIWYRTVSNSNLKSSWSNSQVVYLDSVNPTAPTITGGTSSWVSTSPTIKVSTVGTATSNVKHYEYYKSTSSSTPTNATTATGTTSGNLTVSDQGTTYIWYRTVSNSNLKSSWSNSQVVYLDSVKPTTPTITGGSTSWTTGNMTIKLATESTATSGIAYYQYCASKTVSVQDNSCWTKGTSVTISTEGTYYVYFRAVSNSNLISDLPSYQLVRIDRNIPTITYSVAGGTYSVNQKITITAADANFNYMDIEIYNGTTLVYSTAVANPSTSYTATFNAAGTWTVYSRAFDYKGNKQSQSPENENGWYYQSYTIK